MPAKDLGAKHSCYKCSTKFYDMKKPDPICPKCGADQRESPALKPQPEGGRRGRLAAVPKVVHNSVAFLNDPENVRTGRVAHTAHDRDGTVREIDQLIRVSDCARPVHRIAPDLGADTDAVLLWLGYDQAEIDALRERNAIR